MKKSLDKVKIKSKNVLNYDINENLYDKADVYMNNFILGDAEWDGFKYCGVIGWDLDKDYNLWIYVEKCRFNSNVCWYESYDLCYDIWCGDCLEE